MKLDLIAIRRLSPAGLWDLAGLAALIVTVQKVICLGIGSLVDVRRHTRMAAQYRRELAARKIDNFHLQVKAWVMQCPERIAYVRGVIGEVAIKRWKKNRLLDYAFTKAFGDWKTAFPNGVRRKDKAPRQNAKPRYSGKTHGYNWKPFALVKIANAERILFGQNALKSRAEHLADDELQQKRAAYLKLWNVDIMDISDSEKCTQPRVSRVIKPVRFTPYELEEKSATNMPETIVGTAAVTSEARIYPPPTPVLISPEATKNITENKVVNIEDPKPP